MQLEPNVLQDRRICRDASAASVITNTTSCIIMLYNYMINTSSCCCDREFRCIYESIYIESAMLMKVFCSFPSLLQINIGIVPINPLRPKRTHFFGVFQLLWRWVKRSAKNFQQVNFDGKFSELSEYAIGFWWKIGFNRLCSLFQLKIVIFKKYFFIKSIFWLRNHCWIW